MTRGVPITVSEIPCSGLVSIVDRLVVNVEGNWYGSKVERHANSPGIDEPTEAGHFKRRDFRWSK